MFDIKTLLSVAVQKEASDLHLAFGVPPVLRIHGALLPLKEFGTLDGNAIKEMVFSILTDAQKEKFTNELDLDFSLHLPQLGRFRVNIYIAQQKVGASFRVIPTKIKTLKELGLPAIISQLCMRKDGLILITGPTGSGKTTTLASMVELINQARNCRIVTIEDPIEYVLYHKKSMIIQREVYQDTKSFPVALIQSLRQDPNVICLGEMRDLDTIQTALRAAETGHLVISTLHTPNSIETINRIIDVFPPYQHEQIRTQLASCLGAVVAQKLLLRRDKRDRVVATEVLLSTHAVKHLIREQKTEQISTIIETGMNMGMHTMDSSIIDLYKKGIIDREVASSELANKENRKKLESAI
ncbi:MAG: type IV pili twitching motility protein PilT [Candidatus Omnitrophota bacterium]|mgnify:CR=1 FL=1|nr:MAG: type IV pili twitching motility protein PilT [Candidatus Omnitrophota bacterium]